MFANEVANANIVITHKGSNAHNKVFKLDFNLAQSSYFLFLCALYQL